MCGQVTQLSGPMVPSFFKEAVSLYGREDFRGIESIFQQGTFSPVCVHRGDTVAWFSHADMCNLSGWGSLWHLPIPNHPQQERQ